MEPCNTHHLLEALNLLYECRSAKTLPDTVQQVLTATIPCDLTGWYDATQEHTVRSYDHRMRPLTTPFDEFDRYLQSFFRLHPFTRYMMNGGKDTVLRLSDFSPSEDFLRNPLFMALNTPHHQYVIGARLNRPEDGFIALVCSRVNRDFDAQEMLLLDTVMKHIQRHATVLGLLPTDGTESSVPEQSTCRKKLTEAFGLTSREEEIAYWVSMGKTNSDIAVILGISPHTVRTHLQNIFVKISIETRAALAHTVWTLCDRTL